MCLAHAPMPVPPSPPAPDPVNTKQIAKGVETSPAVQAAQALAARLGTGGLQVPFNNVNVPQ